MNDTGMTRKMRRVKRAMARREERKNGYDEFIDATENYKKTYPDYCKRSRFVSCYQNSIYVVRIYAYDETFVQVAINRFDDEEIRRWDTIQKIKNDVFGKEAWALEIYPKESELQNVANIRWVFLSNGEQFIGLNKKIAWTNNA